MRSNSRKIRFSSVSIVCAHDISVSFSSVCGCVSLTLARDECAVCVWEFQESQSQHGISIFMSNTPTNLIGQLVVWLSMSSFHSLFLGASVCLSILLIFLFVSVCVLIIFVCVCFFFFTNSMSVMSEESCDCKRIPNEMKRIKWIRKHMYN